MLSNSVFCLPSNFTIAKWGESKWTILFAGIKFTTHIHTKCVSINDGSKLNLKMSYANSTQWTVNSIKRWRLICFFENAIKTAFGRSIFTKYPMDKMFKMFSISNAKHSNDNLVLWGFFLCKVLQRRWKRVTIVPAQVQNTIINVLLILVLTVCAPGMVKCHHCKKRVKYCPLSSPKVRWNSLFFVLLCFFYVGIQLSIQMVPVINFYCFSYHNIFEINLQQRNITHSKT